MSTPVFRFAPSPNGRLHLGHAASALLNARLARVTGGRFLLRIEDIDTTRCRTEFDHAVLDDLAWLGLVWEQPVLRQSSRFACYREALDRLEVTDLVYPCFCTRKELAADGATRNLDPDGAPLYGGHCRALSRDDAHERATSGEPFALRIDMTMALAAIDNASVSWLEGHPMSGLQEVTASPAIWGDAVLRRKEFPASYHLAVVIDDAFQGVTHVVRGQDLYHATALHRLLQILLGLPAPCYHHHDLIVAPDGEKLSKSRGSPSLADLRALGLTRNQVQAMAAI